jgi:hypothetical protein
VRLAGQLVQELEADAVDLVVDVQAEWNVREEDFDVDRHDEGSNLPANVLAVVFHDHVNEVINSC